MRLKIPTKDIDLILVSTMALLCACILILSRDIAGKEKAIDWLLKKEATLISCNKNDLAGSGSAGDKNNGGCAHQLGTSCLLTISADKRNKTYAC